MGRVTERRSIVHIDTSTDTSTDKSTGTSTGESIDRSTGTSIDRSTGTSTGESTGTSTGTSIDGSGSSVMGRAAGVVTVVRRMDTLAGEEPLEIRIGRMSAAPGPAGGERERTPLAVTMRTPGDDIDLAIGFLLTEGLIGAADDVVTAILCAGTNEPNTYNVVDVTLASHVPQPDVDPTRNFYTTSSCGVCGKASIDAVRTRSRFDVRADPTEVDATTLTVLPDRLRAAQKTFDRTGGLHAAGLFTAGGDLVCVREDVGRHNAVDKVVGWALREHRLPLTGHVLLVSGRASFELVQKASMAGIPVLAAVSAPSSLAVDLADEAGLTLVGFLRGPTMNVYAGAARISA